MVDPSRNRPRTLDRRAGRGLASGLSLPPAGRRRLLCHPLAQSFLAPLSVGSPGRPDRASAWREPADGFPAAGRLCQGGHPVSPSSHGRPLPRQTVAPLCRPDCRVRPDPPRGQPLRYPRLHRTHLGSAGLDGRRAQVPQEVWSGPRQPCCGHHRRRDADQRGRGARGRRLGPPADGSAARPAGPAAGAPLFVATTHYAGAFLLLPQALDWLQLATTCLSDDYGSLQRGFLTSVFGLVTGLGRIFHLDEMDDSGFALLTGGHRCPTRQQVGAWRRHLPWYEVDAFCRRSFAWDRIQGEDALVSYDEHTLPRWTRKFHIPKGYVTTRNKHMRCEKLFYSYDVLQGR